MPDIIPHSNLTLYQAFRLARDAGMHLIGNGTDIKISPIIPPGWREIPIRIKIAAPDAGRVACHDPEPVAA